MNILKKIIDRYFPSKQLRADRHQAKTFKVGFKKFTNSGYGDYIHIIYEHPDGLYKNILFPFNIALGTFLRPDKLAFTSSKLKYLRYEPINDSFYLNFEHLHTGKFVVKYSVLELIQNGFLRLDLLFTMVSQHPGKDDKKAVELFSPDKFEV